MTTIVIADTVARAEKIVNAIDAPGLRPFLPTSPRSITHYGAGRGVLADRVLVHTSAFPLSFQVLAVIAPALSFKAGAYLGVVDVDVEA